MNSEIFIIFCEKLIASQDKPVYLIVDNLNVHHANDLKPRISKQTSSFAPAFSMFLAVIQEVPKNNDNFESRIRKPARASIFIAPGWSRRRLPGDQSITLIHRTPAGFNIERLRRSSFGGIRHPPALPGAIDIKRLRRLDEGLNSYVSSGYVHDLRVRNLSKVLNQLPKAAPDLRHVRSMRQMFAYAKSFNQPLEHWNVSEVTDMAEMFWDADAFNQPLEKWDVSRVTHMMGMFGATDAFNQPLEKWNVSNVRMMDFMFSYTKSFNQPLEKWNVSSVNSMIGTFAESESFNQPLEKWDVSNVTFGGGVFDCAKAFNQPLNKWKMKNPNIIVMDSINESVSMRHIKPHLYEKV